MVVVVMVTGHDLPHFLVAPDDAEEAASIRTPQKAIWRKELQSVTGKLKPKSSLIDYCGRGGGVSLRINVKQK